MTKLDVAVGQMKAEKCQWSHGYDYFEFGMVGNSQGRRS